LSLPRSGQNRPSRNDRKKITRLFHFKFKRAVPNWHTCGRVLSVAAKLYDIEFIYFLAVAMLGTLDAIGGGRRTE
jgi:hypothetical protein